MILHCEDSLEGIFTAIYEAFVYKNQMTTPYTDSISISIGDSVSRSLFAQEVDVLTDMQKASKTVETIQKRLGYMVYDTIMAALCHYDENRATAVLGYLVRAFRKETRMFENWADTYVARVMELSRKVGNERQRFLGFLRFRLIPSKESFFDVQKVPVVRHEEPRDILYAQIEPKCNLVPLLMEHFTERYPGENFIIYDEKRRLAIVHEAFHQSMIVTGANLNVLSDVTDEFEELWKQYFKTMEIKERHNETCQRNMMPLWYRKNMLEQQLSQS